jgi:hypothetical protein
VKPSLPPTDGERLGRGDVEHRWLDRAVSVAHSRVLPSMSWLTAVVPSLVTATMLIVEPCAPWITGEDGCSTCCVNASVGGDRRLRTRGQDCQDQASHDDPKRINRPGCSVIDLEILGDVDYMEDARVSPSLNVYSPGSLSRNFWLLGRVEKCFKGSARHVVVVAES